MAYIHFDRHYAPCAFLIVRKGGDPYEEKDTVLVQTDWDYPGIARRMGHQTCRACDYTDGTVDVEKMIDAAFQHIWDHRGEEFEGLEEYFYE